jgi:sugar phosphate isomerase/epimerase
VPIHEYGSSAYFDNLTSDEVSFTRDLGHAAGLELGTILLGSGDAPAAMVLQLPPNYTLHRHAHDCHRVEIIVRGSIQLEDGRTLGPGDLWVSAPGEFYGPHTAGTDGAVTMEVFSTAAGFAPIPEDDSSEASDLLREIRARTLAAQADQ